MNLVISTRTIFILLLIFFGLWTAFQIQEIIITIFMAALISMAVVPVIEKLTARKLSRAIATATVYATLIILIVFLLTYGFSPLVEQTTLFFSQLPNLLDSVLSHPLIQPVSKQLIDGITSQLSFASGSILQITLNVFATFISLVTVIVFSFYFSLEFESLKRKAAKIFRSEKNREMLEKILKEAEVKIGSWVRGEIILGLVIGVMTYIGLTILRVNYAVPLSLIAGILEIVPMIGPIISAVPAVIVGFSMSPVSGLGVLALFILIQQIENTLVVPKVMQRAVDLDPILTLAAILIGGKLFGILGALLSVPVTLVVFIVLKHLYYKAV